MSDIMTPEEIADALARLAADAIACIERTLRGSVRPNKAQVDCAWRVVHLAQDREVDESVPVDELANVLLLVNP